jgi:hypothetical protein
MLFIFAASSPVAIHEKFWSDGQQTSNGVQLRNQTKNLHCLVLLIP